MIAGPSGVGKGTVVRRLLQLRPDLVLSVSATTREPRHDEVDGRDYHFLSPHRFQELVDEGAFLEWAEIFGHRSGTLWGPVADQLESGLDVVLEIDVQGAATVRERVPDSLLIFLAPPSLDVLGERLRTRRTETETSIARRLAAAEREMAASEWFDRIVVNDDVERAAREVAAIIDGESNRSGHRGAERS